MRYISSIQDCLTSFGCWLCWQVTSVDLSGLDEDLERIAPSEVRNILHQR